MNDNRGTVTILYRRGRSGRLISYARMRAVPLPVRARAEDEIVILIVLVTGNRFSRARDSIAGLFGYTKREGSTPLRMRTIRKERAGYVTHPSPSSGDLGY